jgi:small-conductance mechanosensitive channel
MRATRFAKFQLLKLPSTRAFCVTAVITLLSAFVINALTALALASIFALRAGRVVRSSV